MNEIKKTLFDRVLLETNSYKDHFDAALDHLIMADSHLFEEFEGRDFENVRSDLDKIIKKLSKYLVS